MTLEDKIEYVKDILRDKKIAISFSGGADSSLLAYLAIKVCSDVLAITFDNNILPEGFVSNTVDFCKKYNIKHEIIFRDFYKYDDIISNNKNRCFLCRREMYNEIISVANKNNFSIIVDGTNITDLTHDRPGILVNYENNIKSPFVEAKLTSNEIHEYLDKNNIPYSNSTTCLATRLPFGVKLTKEKYDYISKSEKPISREKDEINIYYKNNSFEYQLPYKIDLDKTIIDNVDIEIKESGLVKGSNFNSYNEAENEFMRILPKIRRKL